MDVSAMAGIAAGVTALAGKIIDIVKSSRDSELKAELTSVIIEMQQKILELQGIMYSMKDENEQLKKHIKLLESIKDIENSITRIPDRTYGIYKTGNGLEISICMNCWDIKNKIVQMDKGHGQFYICHVCGNETRRRSTLDTREEAE